MRGVVMMEEEEEENDGMERRRRDYSTPGTGRTFPFPPTSYATHLYIALYLELHGFIFIPTNIADKTPKAQCSKRDVSNLRHCIWPWPYHFQPHA